MYSVWYIVSTILQVNTTEGNFQIERIPLPYVKVAADYEVLVLTFLLTPLGTRLAPVFLHVHDFGY